MIHVPKTIRVAPGSELDRLLAEANTAPVELESRGVRYRLDRVDTAPAPKTPPDPEQVARSIAGIQAAAGGWKDLVDAEAIMERFAILRGQLPRHVRRQVGDLDLLIGATALEHDLRLFTYNRKDFDHIPGLTLA